MAHYNGTDGGLVSFGRDPTSEANLGERLLLLLSFRVSEPLKQSSFTLAIELTHFRGLQVTNFQLIGKNLLLGITNIPVMSLNPNQLTEIEAALDLPPRAASLSKSSLTKINLNHNVNLLAKSAYEATISATDLLPTLFDDPDKPKKKVSDKDNGHGVITLEVRLPRVLPFTSARVFSFVLSVCQITNLGHGSPK